MKTSELRSPRIAGFLFGFLTLCGSTLIGCSPREKTVETQFTLPSTEVHHESEKRASAATETKKEESRQPSSVGSAQKTYVVQIGAFTKKENAEGLLHQLQKKDYPVILKTLDHKTFGPMYLVRLHPFTDRSEAQQYKVRLTDSEKLQPTLIIPNARR